MDLPDPEQAFWVFAGCRVFGATVNLIEEDLKYRIRARYNKVTVPGSTMVVVSTSS